MFPWLMFKRGYTDFKLYATENDGKRMTAASLKPSRGLLETYLNMHSRARDHSSTLAKSHANPCRDHRDYPVIKNVDGQTDRCYFSFI